MSRTARRNGHEATEEIRKLGFRQPIIALTAHAVKSEHDKCRRSGWDDVLVKPINRRDLILGMSKHLA